MGVDIDIEFLLTLHDFHEVAMVSQKNNKIS